MPPCSPPLAAVVPPLGSPRTPAFGSGRAAVTSATAAAAAAAVAAATVAGAALGRHGAEDVEQPVDGTAEGKCPAPADGRIAHIVGSAGFAWCIKGLIAANAIYLGISAFGRLPRAVDITFGSLFTLAFFAEVGLKARAQRWAYLRSPANAAALAAALCGAAAAWLAPLATAADGREMPAARLLRALVALQVGRCVELHIALSRPARSVLVAVQPWLTVAGPLLLLLYAGAVALAMSLPDDGHLEGFAGVDYFGSLPGSMLTLVGLCAFAEWATVLRPVLQESPLSAMIFVMIAIMVSLLVISLLVGIVVEQATKVADVAAASHFASERRALAQLAAHCVSAYAEGAGLQHEVIAADAGPISLEQAVCRLLFHEGALCRRTAPSSLVEDLRDELLAELRSLRREAAGTCSSVGREAVPPPKALFAEAPSPTFLPTVSNIGGHRSGWAKQVDQVQPGSSGRAGRCEASAVGSEEGAAALSEEELQSLKQELGRLSGLREELNSLKSIALEGARLAGKEEERKEERDRRFEDMDVELRRCCAVESAQRHGAGPAAPAAVGGAVRRFATLLPGVLSPEIEQGLRELRLELRAEFEALRGARCADADLQAAAASARDLRQELGRLHDELLAAASHRDRSGGSPLAAPAVASTAERPREPKESKQRDPSGERQKPRAWFASVAKGIEGREAEKLAAEFGLELCKLRDALAEASAKWPEVADLQRLQDELAARLLSELRPLLEADGRRQVVAALGESPAPKPQVSAPRPSASPPVSPPPRPGPGTSPGRSPDLRSAVAAAGKLDVGRFKSPMPAHTLKQLCQQGVVHIV